MLATNQIAVFFNHQCPLKESINTLYFSHGDNDHQGKVASKNTTFGWVWPVVSRPTRSSIDVFM